MHNSGDCIQNSEQPTRRLSWEIASAGSVYIFRGKLHLLVRSVVYIFSKMNVVKSQVWQPCNRKR